ncbi:MAG: hypothetical protein IPP90_11075 [Gemmatimonadaceae bacterium]|nr:hypothetical protein [Gemmatimonadaceae bacterium]
MTHDSRRAFIGRISQLGVAAVLGGDAGHEVRVPPTVSESGEWDLSWVKRVENTRDRAVIDSAGIADGFCLQIATRYLDNCNAVYGVGKHRAQVVLNIRTRAIPLALNDTIWNRYEIGADAQVTDPLTKQPSRRNLWMTVPDGQPAATGSMTDIVRRGAIILVCDFALGHLANRMAAKAGESADSVHRALRAGFVNGAIAMPSGMFALARAQNAGCAVLTA